jgi:hypothetical protein
MQKIHDIIRVIPDRDVAELSRDDRDEDGPTDGADWDPRGQDWLSIRVRGGAGSERSELRSPRSRHASPMADVQYSG